jgi:cAMP phosphodiesterase
MKVQLLPSSIEAGCEVSQRQHLTCLVIDDCVAFDAGSLALSCSGAQRANIRDVVISHSHLDHVAGLPIFIDDLFASLAEPVRIHATSETIAILERDIFNWSVYPNFSKLRNENGPVLKYEAFEPGRAFELKHLTVLPITVNHHVESVGFLVSDGNNSIGITGDTSSTFEIWTELNRRANLRAVLIECAFSNGLRELAAASNHMTPELLAVELDKFLRPEVPVFVVNIKPMYRETIVEQINELAIPNLNILEIGRDYEF